MLRMEPTIKGKGANSITRFVRGGKDNQTIEPSAAELSPVSGYGRVVALDAGPLDVEDRVSGHLSIVL